MCGEKLFVPERGMTVSEADLRYVARWVTWALVLALGLHVVSAVGLGLLQWYGLSQLGYLASGTALLLMALRPLGQAWEYLVARLTSIGRDAHFPRDDILAVKNTLSELEGEHKRLAVSLDLQETGSWAATVESRVSTLAPLQETLRTQLEDLRRLNDEAHRQLAREAEAAASRMAEDGRVLNHARELVRFFKSA